MRLLELVNILSRKVSSEKKPHKISSIFKKKYVTLSQKLLFSCAHKLMEVLSCAVKRTEFA
jgi:hypothetical protein